MCNLPQAALDCVTGGKGCVVCGIHLLSLQIYVGSFETGQQGEMVGGFSQSRCLLRLCSAQQGTGRLSMG
jgi:hypothetical protein